MEAAVKIEATGPSFLSVPVSYSNSRKGLNIIIVADGPITSVELFCRPLEFMRKGLGVSYSLFYERILPARSDWSQADIAVFIRVRHAATVRLAREIKAEGIRVINVTDDDFQELIATLRGDPTLSAIAADLVAGGCLDNIREIASLSDKMIVFSETLAERFASLASVEVAPAICGIEFYDSLPKVMRLDSEKHQIRIGYAGSPTHSEDISIIEKALMQTIEYAPSRVFVESIGQPIPFLEGSPNYRYFPPVAGIENYMRLQHSRDWDIAVAPLADTPFNKSKSDNKFRSYASAGIPGIYSDVAAFQKAVQNGRNGLLVANEPSAWSSGLRMLVDNGYLRTSLKNNALEDVRRIYSLESVSLAYLSSFVATNRGLRVLVIGFLHLPTMSIDIKRPFAIMSKTMSIRFRLKEVSDVRDQDIEWAEVLVVVRTAEPPVSQIISKAKQSGKKVVFSWDDDLFAMPPDVPDLYAHYNNPEVRRAFESVLASSDIIKVSTKRLAKTTEKYNKNILIAPYGFDFSLVEGVKIRPKSSSIRVGYYGSPGRGNEFRCVVAALERICSSFRDIELEFFGFKPSGFHSIPRSTFIPFTDDYEESVKQLISRGWDIGLAPLAMTDLCRAKLPTKYRDYAAAGAAGVYTNIECYTEEIFDGETGLIVDNSERSWYSAIARLIKDVDLRTRIAQNASADVRRRFGIDVAVKAWETVFRRLGFSLPRSADERISG